MDRCRADEGPSSPKRYVPLAYGLLACSLAPIAAFAQDAASAPAQPSDLPEIAQAGDSALSIDVDQILPPSPVAGGNDPNASDDTLYILQIDAEDAQEEGEDERGVLTPSGRPPGQTNGPRSHVLFGPSGRVAAKKVISPKVSIEAFVTGGLVDFRQSPSPFEIRDSSVSGGVSSTADFGILNGSFAYEHRAAYANTYSTWKSTGDKVGASFNRTFPFFVPDLRVTPQLVTARESVDPAGGSAVSVDPTVGFSYKASERLSFAASGGEGLTFLYALPGYRHNNGLKFSLGATYKIIDAFVVTLGASTNRTILYGLPQYRADGSLSPSVNLRYSPTSMLSFTLSANYARFLSNVPGSSTFKYNVSPGVSLTVPL